MSTTSFVVGVGVGVGISFLVYTLWRKGCEVNGVDLGEGRVAIIPSPNIIFVVNEVLKVLVKLKVIKDYRFDADASAFIITTRT